MDILSASHIESLKMRILDFPGVLDPPSQHHEFASGMHGRKCDLDEIPEEDPLFGDLAEATAHRVEQLYPRLPNMIITIANGGNRFAQPLRDYFGSEVSVRTTLKNTENKDILLNERTEKALQRTYPEFVLLVDDLGTTGSVAAKVGNKILGLQIPSLKEIRAFTPVQRRDDMEQLRMIGIEHDGMINIKNEAPTYTKRECEAKYYCKNAVQLIPYGR